MKDTGTFIAMIIATLGVLFLTVVSLEEIKKKKAYTVFIIVLWLMNIFTWVASYTLRII